MRRAFHILYFTVFASCAVPGTASQHTINLSESGYGTYNVFIYSVQQKDRLELSIANDTLGLFCSDVVLSEIDSQKCMQWQRLAKNAQGGFYSKDSNSNPSITGIKVNDSLLFIHPPREAFQILQFCPYPYFKNLGRIGNSWKWNFEIGKNWAIDTLYPITDAEAFHVTYTFSDTTTLLTRHGSVFCYHVIANSTSGYGTSRASYFLSPKLGIVRSEITAINGRSFVFELIEKLEGLQGIKMNSTFLKMYNDEMNKKINSGRAWYRF